MLDVEVADDTQVEAKRAQLRTGNPIDAGIYVHGPGETVTMHNLQINADRSEEDGRVLRLAIATGSSLALHYLGEGEGTNYATAREMGEPTARFFQDRQQRIIWYLHDLVTVAYRRYCVVQGITPPDDLQLQTSVTEVARADNQSIASATLSIVRALAISARQNWIDDETALSIALKFAGENYTIEEIRDILATTTRTDETRRDEPYDQKAAVSMSLFDCEASPSSSESTAPVRRRAAPGGPPLRRPSAPGPLSCRDFHRAASHPTPRRASPACSGALRPPRDARGTARCLSRPE